MSAPRPSMIPSRRARMHAAARGWLATSRRLAADPNGRELALEALHLARDYLRAATAARTI